MRKIIISLILAMLAGCGNSTTQEALITYTNEDLIPLIEIEDEATSRFNSIGQSFTNDYDLAQRIEEEVIPLYEELVKGLNNVNVQNEEIEEAHQIFLEGSMLQLEGMTKIVEAIQSNDQQMAEEAHRLLEQGEVLVTQFSNELSELYETYDVEIQ
ncbi:hypothetical protein BpOF4_09485 [Alkalihalophilus pseudofirmus OF4]|uniref:Lipoprotein n=1 Tax=Alkalihalophilus pseudofirmus (strain ATCC BAA-2126 / JCM 17055 / OF4) TaxID=398511 RepID=D3FSI4_ALKPO|nr:hypothetical protein [Alkalihalophilus pseudofirmus]ADC49952.1 hypothetical protein BpOF4_09485 [Alkalihalophilus pseudofirmus OF4]